MLHFNVHFQPPVIYLVLNVSCSVLPGMWASVSNRSSASVRYSDIVSYLRAVSSLQLPDHHNSCSADAGFTHEKYGMVLPHPVKEDVMDVIYFLGSTAKLPHYLCALVVNTALTMSAYRTFEH